MMRRLTLVDHEAIATIVALFGCTKAVARMSSRPVLPPYSRQWHARVLWQCHCHGLGLISLRAARERLHPRM